MRFLKDSHGRSLSKDDVKVLAHRNIIASNENDDVDKMKEADLLQWATGPDGSFNTAQAYNLEMRFKGCFEVGDQVSPKKFINLFGGKSIGPGTILFIQKVEENNRYMISLGGPMYTTIDGKNLRLVKVADWKFHKVS